MALRLGTGGLKYPLPNQVTAQQSIASASAGGSASASAYGANRAFAANKMRVQADLANSAAERDYRARAQMAEQGFRAQQNFYDREHQAGAQLQGQEFQAAQQDQRLQNAREMQWQNHYFDAERQRQQQQFITDRDKTQFEREQQAQQQQIADRDAQQQENIKSGVLELTPQAQKRLDAIAEARAAMGSDFSPADREEFERKAQEEERRIRNTAKPARGPTGADAFNQGTVLVDPTTGRAYNTPEEAPPGTKLIPHNVNDRKPLVDNSKDDEQKRSWIEKRADDLMKNAREGENYTPETAARQATKDWDSRQKGLQPPAAPETPAPAAPGQPAPAAPVGAGGNLGGTLIPRPGVQLPPGQGAPAPAPAQSSAVVPPPGWQGPVSFNDLPRPSSAAERDALPPGTTYVTPDGQFRKKK